MTESAARSGLIQRRVSMCDQCNSIDETIDRYRRLRKQTSDKQTRQAAAELITELEAKKAALHRE